MTRKRPIAAASVTAVLALLAAGCGGASHSSLVPAVSTSPDGTRHLLPATKAQAAAALQASRCMRTHGIPNFPDPILGGHFGFMAGSGIDPDSPTFMAAKRYCTTRYLHVHWPTPAEFAQRNADAVKFSACMRSHGATDFPDPRGQGVIRLPSGSYMNTPNARRAEAACKALEVDGVVLSSPN